MARVSTYLNFAGNTEQAFQFYKAVFGTEFNGPIMRFRDAPHDSSQPPMPEELQNMVMHIELPILAGHVLMGTDCPDSMGMPVIAGNNMHITLEPDSRADTERLFHALSAGGQIEMPLQDMFWGDYFGNFTDQFGVHWMLNCSSKS